jgi:hypothetical protein
VMIFRLSQRLKARIRAGRVSQLPRDENPCADWSARLFTADRTQYILLSHTASLYSVVMFARGITHDALFIHRALDSIREFMACDGLGLLHANFIAPASAAVRFGKALNRSVTGSMNELQAIARLHLQSGECSPFEVGFKLNEIPLSAVAVGGSHYATPREAFSRIKLRALDVTEGSTLSRSHDMPTRNRDASRRRPAAEGTDRPACGLCGNTKNLTKTECCGHWICDDAHQYVAFSSARNSCYRNHDRYTLCSVHHQEGHKGRWQDCAKCRKSVPTEMYVYYGTNEYNFEKLSNPPAYEPTHCRQCGRVIVLGEGGYSVAGDDHFCGRCAVERMGGGLIATVEDEPDMAEGTTPAPGGSARTISGEPHDIELQDLRDQVPEAYRDRFDAIVQRTDTFCDRHLNDEYKQLAQVMAASICQPYSPVLQGKPDGWAAGVIYALGRVNFLTDPSQEPHMKSEEIARGIGVSPATMQVRAKVVREGLDLMAFDPQWTLPSRLGDNPLMWIMEVNGLPMDIRTAPREVQVVAYEQGLIPYIPADRNQ